MRHSLFCALLLIGLTLLPQASIAAADELSQVVTTRQISGGENFSCGIFDGAAYCWGNNADGRLGIGVDFNRTWFVKTPAPVVGLGSNMLQVATGSRAACGLLSNGTVKCWGDNSYGQLGNGTTNDSLVPVAVVGLSNVKSLAVGMAYDHMCAVKQSGQVVCWGFNDRGQLGNGTTNHSSTPVNVTGLSSNVETVFVGISTSCAIVAGAAKCWGSGGSGQLGNGSFNSSSIPVQVSGLTSGVTDMALGGISTCAIVAGAAKCWGSNNFGQLGNGTLNTSLTPAQVYGLTANVKNIMSGYNHVCAIVNTSIGARGNEMQCWGNNDFHQVGSTNNYEMIPFTVASTNGSTKLGSGRNHSCTIIMSSVMRCWGLNSDAQLGIGTQEPEVATPTDVIRPIAHVIEMDLGAVHSCVTLANSLNRCWGDNQTYQIGTGVNTIYPNPTYPQGLPAAGLDIAAGGAGCVISTDKRVFCWGGNQSGEIGNGTTTIVATPTYINVPGITEQIDSTSASTCAVSDTGQVHCWGNNQYGQVGDGTTINRSTPKLVNLGGQATSVSTGVMHTCALMTTGQVKCWGNNQYGQLGINSTTNASTPQLVHTISNAVELHSNGSHTCALLASSELRCWGSNNYGQIGNGNTINAVVPFSILTGVKSVGLGFNHSCAIMLDGTLKCWGFNSDGQLGNGTTTNSHSPITISGINDLKTVRGGIFHTCAAQQSTPTIYCWGDNTYGQLGNGSTTDSLVPVLTTTIVP